MKRCLRHFVPASTGFALSLLACAPAFADARLSECAAIADDAGRLSCYDRIAGRRAPAQAVVESAAASAPPRAAAQGDGLLSSRWELDEGHKGGTFRFRFHKPTYILPYRHSDRVNETPHTPQATRSVAQPLPVDDVEVKYQLSFKVKLLESLPAESMDLWFGYTQQSHWQLYAKDRSSPFRETNYEPELMLVWRTDYDLLGLKGRFVNFGFVHQSNGRSNPQSRSWNRLYAQFGMERGDFALLVRPWLRLREKSELDDNPDISSYVGRGDIVALFTRKKHSLSLMARNNLSLGSNRGAVQLDWTFPLIDRAEALRGHFQIFSGYGESLVDYNHRQTSVGLGLSIAQDL